MSSSSSSDKESSSSSSSSSSKSSSESKEKCKKIPKPTLRSLDSLPFHSSNLAKKVQQVLDEPTVDQATKKKSKSPFDDFVTEQVDPLIAREGGEQ